MEDTKEDKSVLVIEQANTDTLKVVNDALMFGWSKQYCKELVLDIVRKTKEQLRQLHASDELILNTQNSIMATFMNAWNITTGILKKESKKDELGLIGQALLSMQSNAPKETTSKGMTINLMDGGVGIGKGSIKNLRDFVTANETLGASQRFIDYTDRIKETLNQINERLADETMTLTGKDGRKLSVRNLAEIETRYNMISEDLKRNNIEVSDFVIASSHADASERCSWWQGKIFIVDLEVNSRPMGQYKGFKPHQDILGYIDGKPYYSLLEACNNGFLSYNCQHRLIKYYKGAKPPEYDFISVKKKRNLTAIQRNMENTVRKFKRREVLSSPGVTITRKNPYTNEMQVFKERDYNILMSKYWQERYSEFSNDNGLPEYRWRLRITETERKIDEK